MTEFEWLESFELRVPEIDGDLRTILELMTAVRSAATVGDRARAEQYLDRLLLFSQSHFVREEQLLRCWGYPKVEKHASYHAELQQRAGAVRRACRAIETSAGFRKGCDALMSFLVEDVVRGDLKLKSFLEETNVAPPDTLRRGQNRTS